MPTPALRVFLVSVSYTFVYAEMHPPLSHHPTTPAGPFHTCTEVFFVFITTAWVPCERNCQNSRDVPNLGSRTRSLSRSPPVARRLLLAEAPHNSLLLPEARGSRCLQGQHRVLRCRNFNPRNPPGNSKANRIIPSLLPRTSYR